MCVCVLGLGGGGGGGHESPFICTPSLLSHMLVDPCVCVCVCVCARVYTCMTEHFQMSVCRQCVLKRTLHLEEHVSMLAASPPR